MTTKPSNLQIDSRRLWDALMETAQFGATPKGGIKRLTLSEEDRKVRDWFRAACEKAGCKVYVDQLGAMFAVRPGRDNSKLPIGFGSHLDTQPTGGKFDGILGTLAGLEVIRTLNDAGIETDAPLCLVNWTNEEGSRFAPAMMASGAYVGEFTVDHVLSCKDADGVTVKDALDKIGYRGSEKSGARKLGAFVELHIEQGPILEAEGKTIGVVEHGQGVAWYDGYITGFESHAGTTPMPLRRDALSTLAEIALAIERLTLAHGPNAVATVGEAAIKSPSRNVIPGEMRFTLDLRSVDADTIATLDKEIRAAITNVAAKRKVAVTFERIWYKPPTHFDPKIVEAVEQATTELGYSNRRMVSGAGHDACNMNNVMPTAMIFVPCKDGVSHNELEDATQPDCAAGANVLLHTLLSLAGVASG